MFILTLGPFRCYNNLLLQHGESPTTAEKESSEVGDEERDIILTKEWFRWRRQGRTSEIIDKRRPMEEERPPHNQTSSTTDSNV